MCAYDEHISRVAILISANVCTFYRRNSRMIAESHKLTKFEMRYLISELMLKFNGIEYHSLFVCVCVFNATIRNR